MDNDKKLVKLIRKKIKEVKFRYDYRDLDILSGDKGNNLIRHLLRTDKPFMIARSGATEMRCIGEYINKNFFSNKIAEEIFMLSGVFPNDETTLREFCEVYITAISNADIVSLWGVGAESKIVHKHCKNAKFTELHALEPYYFDQPWSSALAGKKVLVVHPFKKSIEFQYKRREELFHRNNILPRFQSLECVQAVQSVAGEKTKFTSWFEALNYMKQEILNKDFDTAIIGAGAYGLPLAAYCKEIGKQSIQMAGATQLLFGIRGKRWDDHPVICKLYNDAWVRPLQSETPIEKIKVEGGSYW